MWNGDVIRGSIKFACVCGLFVTSMGCEQPRVASPAAGEHPAVVVTQPLEKELADFAEFTGRTDAVESVEIRARVSGYLNKIHYKPGREIEAGALLFEIDSRPYDAELERCEATVATARASLKQAQAEMLRAEELHARKISTQADYDKAVADLSHAEASVDSTQASVTKAKLNQDFTKVTAPISGRTSRELITEGNLVTADSTALTTIVSLDPIYAYFDIDERTLLDIQQKIREHKIDSARDRDNVEIRLEMANETGFPHQGVIDVVDNRIDAGTGTMQIRGRFPNSERKLTPGLFIRIQMQLGPARSRLLIPERALAQQQGQRYVYVVSPEQKIERRNVTVGRRDGALRVIETGLKPSDRVVVQGQQRVRPGIEVKLDQETASAKVSASEPTLGQPH